MEAQTPRRRRWVPGGNVVRIAIAVAVVVWGLVVAGEARRVEKDPSFCAGSCHHEPGKGATSAFHAAGHQSLPCQDCHQTSVATGLRLVLSTYTTAVKPVPHGSTTTNDCLSCHEKRPDEWRLIAETAGHRQHRGAKRVDCLSCHAQHSGQTPEAACATCHEDQRLHKATTLGAETCLSCHGFAATPKNIRPPSTVACASCHASPAVLAASGGGVPVRPMKDVNEHALHSGVACQLCHNAHGIVRKVPEGQPACAACHQDVTAQIGSAPRIGPDEHRKCDGCHKQHMPRESALQRCVDCHEKNAKGLVGAGIAAGRTTALKHESCASCHLPHTWKAERGGCMKCHEKETTLFQTRSPPEHKACTDCHEVHGPPPTGAVCMKCHAANEGKHIALAPERHRDCTSCHNPHAPKPEETRGSCAGCHSTELAQVREGPEGHAKAACFTCHKPHGNPAALVDGCATCHAEKAKLVKAAGPPKHRECASCHEPHKFHVSDVAADCARCHAGLFDTANKPFAHVPHQADCKSCHTFHGEPGVPQASCLSCHEKVAAQFHPPNDKHAACDSCHEAHVPASMAPGRCASCHASQAAVASAWPRASAHAKDCSGCHQPHAARQEKACSECHAAEATSAMGGKHDCKQCHAPHTAPPGTGAAWWSRCSSCHAAQVQGAKALGATHSECKNCHQPHRFAEPTCTSCHKDMGTKGLHAGAKHAASCTSCHDPHVKAPPTREQCLRCHSDKRAHEPNAKDCYTCHLFR